MVTFAEMFNNLSHSLSETQEIQSLSSKFAEQSCDRDRISFTDHLTAVTDIVKAQKKYKAKCIKESEKSRSKGNRAFQKSRYEEALSSYTESIMYAPDGSYELGLGFANRSAVAFRLHNYKSCLRDIARALLNSYPDDLRYKLLERRAKCYDRTGQLTAAIESYDEATASLSASILREEKRTKIRFEIKQGLELVKSKLGIVDGAISQPRVPTVPSIDGERSVIFSCASDAFTIAYDTSKGRYPKANREIAIGEVIAVEEPYSSMLFPSYYRSHCYYCCKRVGDGVPCRECSAVLFCDEQCRDTAWGSYHSIECKYLSFLDELDVGMATLALRIIIRTGLAEIWDYDSSEMPGRAAASDVRIARDDTYGSHDYRAVCGLVNHSVSRTVADLFRRTVQAILFLDVLEGSGFFASARAKRSYEKATIRAAVGSHLLRHLMMLPCNAHEITDYITSSDEAAEYANTEIGAALYNTLSLVNHSCDPSVVRHSYGNTCVVRAIRHIHKGDEISDNYGALYATSDLNERQNHLGSQYYFSCRCRACMENWGMFLDLPDSDPTYLCRTCRGNLVTTHDAPGEYECKNCDTKRDLTDIIALLDSSAERYESVLDKVLDGSNQEDHLVFLLDYLEMMDRNVARPWKQYNRCQETIKQVFNTMASHYH